MQPDRLRTIFRGYSRSASFTMTAAKKLRQRSVVGIGSRPGRIYPAVHGHEPSRISTIHAALESPDHILGPGCLRVERAAPTGKSSRSLRIGLPSRVASAVCCRAIEIADPIQDQRSYFSMVTVVVSLEGVEDGLNLGQKPMGPGRSGLRAMQSLDLSCVGAPLCPTRLHHRPKHLVWV